MEMNKKHRNILLSNNVAFAEYGILCYAFNNLCDIVAEYGADGILCLYQSHLFSSCFFFS